MWTRPSRWWIFAPQITKDHSNDRDSASESSIIPRSSYSNRNVKLEWMFLVVKQEFRKISCLKTIEGRRCVCWHCFLLSATLLLLPPLDLFCCATKDRTRSNQRWNDNNQTSKQGIKTSRRVDERVCIMKSKSQWISSRWKQAIYKGKKKNVFSERTW